MSLYTLRFSVLAACLAITNRAHAETVGYWRFEEGTGSTAYDSSPFGNTATITQPDLYSTDVPSPTITSTGAVNNFSLHLSGLPDPAIQFATVPDSPSLRPGKAITIEVSVKLDQNVSGNAGIVNHPIAGSNADSYGLGLRGHAGVSGENYPFFGLQLGGVSTDIDLNTALTVGQWYNLVGVWDGNQVSLYVNGVLAGSISGAAGTISYPTPNSLIIGADVEVDGVTRWSFPGNIDEVRISDAALTPGQFLMPLPEPIPGDANGDGLVTGADYTIWAVNFNRDGGLADGDFNGDGRVTGADYTIWAANFHAGPPSATATSVPEPSTFLLAGIAFVGLVLRFKRFSNTSAPSAR